MTVTHFIPWESKIHVSSSHFKSSMIVPYALYCTWFTPGVSYPDFPYNQPNAFEIDKQIHVFRYWLIWELSVNMIQCREAAAYMLEATKTFLLIKKQTWTLNGFVPWCVAVFSVLMVESRFLSVNLAEKSETCESREAEKDVQPISTCVLCSSCVFVEALIFNCAASTVLQLSKYCYENMHFQYFGTICANVVLQLYNTLSSCSLVHV